MSDSESISAEELGTLRYELSKAGIPGLSAANATSILEESQRLLAPRVHENRVSRYGFLSTAKLKAPDRAALVDVSGLTMDAARGLADGTNSFLVLESCRRAGILFLPEPLGGEHDLVRFRAAIGADVVGVLAHDGTATFCTQRSVAVHQSRTWQTKPAIEDSAAALVQHAPFIPRARAESILWFCSHVLSSRHIGATLVWAVAPLPQDCRSNAVAPTSLASLPFNVCERRNVLALASVLDRTDGATIVAGDGQVLGIGAHLVVSGEARSLIKASSGTRHTSARLFSFDWPQVVAFTVSSDGPVSVFSEGALISEVQFAAEGLPNELVDYINDEREGDVERTNYDAQCSRCGKSYEIRDVFIPGNTGRESVDCVVCKGPLASSKTTDLTARLVKRLPVTAQHA